MKRALSIYYFWGELWKMRNRLSEQSKGRGRGQKWEKGKSHRHMTEITLQNAQHGNTLSVEEPPIQLGSSIGRNTTPIRGPLFTYHGDEFSAPSEDIAMAYATRLPLIPGMPGPSLTWSCYGRTVEEAIQGFNAPFHSSSHQKGKADPRYRISPVVTERLDESLIVLSDHLSWSIADMVNVVPRKVLLFLF